VVIDHGLVIAAGTSEELKDRVGGDVIEFTVPDRTRLARAAEAVRSLSDIEPTMVPEDGLVSVRVGSRGSQALVQAVRELDAAGVTTDGLALRRPSLDDVFLALTGHAAEEADDPDAPASSDGRRSRGGAQRGGDRNTQGARR